MSALICPYCAGAPLVVDDNPRPPARIVDDGFVRTFYVCRTCWRHTVKLVPADRSPLERP